MTFFITWSLISLSKYMFTTVLLFDEKLIQNLRMVKNTHQHLLGHKQEC